MDSILEFKNITKKYGSKVALDDITLSIPKGSIVGLLGPNGSGKTTLLKLATGLLQPTKGEVFACGLKPGAGSKDLVAYQSDKVYLNDWMNVEDLMKMLGDFYTNFNKDKALDMLASLNINPKDKLKEMSKGTKEKVQLITTMCRDVQLYLLDEPIGGVDPAARDYILNTIISNYQEDATVIISTHLIADVEPVLNHILFLKEGHIVRQGDVDDIREETGKSIDALFREEFKC
ncbi:MAG: ABC transporter ATP-binding protein [Treponema sp.]|nr:ABC transporter ATP-binding protein [Treponema sp.]